MWRWYNISDMKITRLVKRYGRVKNLGNYESVRVENEVEAVLDLDDNGNPVENLEQVNSELRKILIDIMRSDFNGGKNNNG
jgi:hypothetical protein